MPSAMPTPPTTCPEKLAFTLAALDAMDPPALARIWAAATAGLHATGRLRDGLQALAQDHGDAEEIIEDLAGQMVDDALAGDLPLAESF